MTKDELKIAINHLRKDPVMDKLIDDYKLNYVEPGRIDLFRDIVRSIISQQLSNKVADTIFQRFIRIDGDAFPEADTLLKIDDQKIRECGISYSKIKYIKGVAEASVSRKLEFEVLNSMLDSEVIAELTELKGIGKWTAEMILIFSFDRPDVFSIGDLGLRNAVSNLYNVDRDDLIRITKISETWKPYRSIASRYLWKSLDNEPKGK